MKNYITSAIGVIGSTIAAAFGGWTAALSTLLIFMAIDFITGWTTAAVFHKSPKSATGALQSRASLKGLCHKGTILFFVLIGYRLDLIVGTSYIRDAVCIAFCANELLSIVENAGLMGIPIPNIITKAIDILNSRSEGEVDNIEKKSG